MQTAIKLLISVVIILLAVQAGKRSPALAGLIATMPLTTLIVLVWLYTDDPGNSRLMYDYTRGVLWGLIPSALFFVTALLLFKKQIPFAIVVAASFLVWFVGALVHRLLVR